MIPNNSEYRIIKTSGDGVRFVVETFKSILPFDVKIPPKIRSFLKKTIFLIPNLQNTVKEQRLRIEELKNLRKHAIELWYLASDKGFEKVNAYYFEKKNRILSN